MAEENQPAVISSAFPAPPLFYKSFTAQNLDCLEGLLNSSSPRSPDIFRPTDPVTAPIPNADTLPPELRNLIPPPLPPGGTYHTFGTFHNIDAGRASDLTSPPAQDHLLSLLHQILFKFLHITHILSIDPAMQFYGTVWEQLEALFKEMHEGINGWRPHQARESLVRTMEEQIRDVKAETQRVRDGVTKAKKVVEAIAKGVVGDEGHGVVNKHRSSELEKEEIRRRKPIERDNLVWEIIERNVSIL